MSAWMRVCLVVVCLTALLGVPAAPAAVSAQTPDSITSHDLVAQFARQRASEQVKTFDCATVTDIPLVECQALVALYDSTAGAGWTTNTNWLTSTTAANWYGVTVSSGHVSQIHLAMNNLSGTLPSPISNLTMLQELDLNINSFGGPIPAWLGNMTQLTTLYLGYTNLYGPAPIELGNLVNLQVLDLSSCDLYGSLPSWFANLTNLGYLFLNSNHLSGSIPTWLGAMTNLVSLELQVNQFSGFIPAEFGNLTNLEFLHLDGNQLSGSIPPEFGNLTNLRILSLRNNQFSGAIPAEFGNLTILRELSLRNNYLSGVVPISFTNLINLCTPGTPGCSNTTYGLDLGHNYLTTPATPQALADFLATHDPDWATTQASLFTSCSEVTSIPVAECSALVDLYNESGETYWTNHDNWLVNNDPDTWYGVTVSGGHVSQLNLGINNLQGTLPTSLGNLTSLEILDLLGNWLSGPIPSSLGNLTQLQTLNLKWNNFTGPIPSSLGSLTKLKILVLSGNDLNGPIPSELGNMINLQDLELDHCQLSGNFPAWISNLTNLQYLYLDGNQFSGSIPAWLGSLTNLIELGLVDNQFSGIIPPELGNLVNLHGLALNMNQLSGTIPSELGNLTNLQNLTLNNNQLSGEIPNQFVSLTNLETLSLHNNQLFGTIPSWLGNHLNLWMLNLSSNQFSGTIPSELGNLTNLQFLMLGNNQLSGAVPVSFTNLVKLLPPIAYGITNGLDLNYNRLTVPATPQALADFLAAYNPGWDLTQAASTTLGSSGGELTSNDGDTTLTFPAGSAPSGTVVTFVPQPGPSADTGSLGFANNSFLVEVTTGSKFDFTQPVTVSLTYSDADLGMVPWLLAENALKLYWWSGSAWVDALTTCPVPGSYTRDLQANTLQLPICKSGEFALLGTYQPMIFLPMVKR